MNLFNFLSSFLTENSAIFIAEFSLTMVFGLLTLIVLVRASDYYESFEKTIVDYSPMFILLGGVFSLIMLVLNMFGNIIGIYLIELFSSLLGIASFCITITYMVVGYMMAKEIEDEKDEEVEEISSSQLRRATK